MMVDTVNLTEPRNYLGDKSLDTAVRWFPDQAEVEVPPSMGGTSFQEDEAQTGESK